VIGFHRVTAPPDPSELVIERVLLASEGRAIPDRAIEFAAELARPQQAPVNVFAIARVYGVAFGLPAPGLLPTRREWEEHRKIVTQAVKALRKRGVEAKGRVTGTRKAAARICEEAYAQGCDVIVMAADPPRNRVLADLMWSQEPYRVRRRSKIPVYLVPADDDG
jgi:nucleotide-binding universal stress UspA family protein